MLDGASNDGLGDAVAGTVKRTEGTPATPTEEKQLVPDEAQERPKGWEREEVSDGQSRWSVDQLGHGGIE